MSKIKKVQAAQTAPVAPKLTKEQLLAMLGDLMKSDSGALTDALAVVGEVKKQQQVDAQTAFDTAKSAFDTFINGDGKMFGEVSALERTISHLKVKLDAAEKAVTEAKTKLDPALTETFNAHTTRMNEVTAALKASGVEPVVLKVKAQKTAGDASSAPKGPRAGSAIALAVEVAKTGGTWQEVMTTYTGHGGQWPSNLTRNLAKAGINHKLLTGYDGK